MALSPAARFRNKPQKNLDEPLHFDEVSNQSPNPIFAVDQNGVILAWNPGCEKTFLYDEKIIGQNIQSLLSEDKQLDSLAKISSVFLEKVSFNNLEWEFIDQLGARQLINTCLYPLLDSSGSVQSCIVSGSVIVRSTQSQSVVERQLQELQVLHAIALACSDAVNEDSLIEDATRIVGTSLYPDNFGVLLTDNEEPVINRHRSYHDVEEVSPNSLPLDIGICGKVVRGGKTLRINDIRNEPAYFEADPRTRSELCVPLKIGDLVIGVINAESYQVDAFDEDDERLLTIIAGQLTNTIEQLRVEGALRQRVQELQAITHLSTEINSQLDLTAVLNSIVRSAVEISNSDGCGLYLEQPDGKLRLVATYGVSSAFVDFINQTGVDMQGSVIGRAILSRMPFQVSNLSTDTEYTMMAHARMEGIQAILAVPMQHGGKNIGGIAVWFRNPHISTKEEIQFIQTLANQSVNAVENARLFESEREQRKLADVLRTTGTALTTLINTDDLLDSLLFQLSRIVPYDAANILLVEGQRFQVARASGYDNFGSKFTEIVNQLSADLTSIENFRKMLADKKPIIVPDISADSTWVDLLPESPFQSWIGIPILIQDEVAAVFSLDKLEAGFYQPAHAERLSIFAGQAGLAMQNSRLFDETRRRAFHLETLNRIITEAVSAPDPEYLVNAVLNLSMQAIGVEKGVLWTADVSAIRDIPPVFIQYETQKSSGEEARTYTTVAINDWSMVTADHPDYPWATLFLPQKINASLSVPILFGDCRIGGLALATQFQRIWLDDEIQLLEAIGQQVGSAIERHSLLKKTSEQARQMQLILDTVPEGVLLLDSHYRVMMANPAARGYLSNLVDFSDLSQPINKLADKPIREIFETASPSTWIELQSEEDNPRNYELAVRPLEAMTFNAGWVLVLRDVTEERLSLAKLQIQERLATVGQLAAGIAHDFNNIMAAIVVYTDLLGADPTLSTKNRAHLKIIHEQIQRAASLIHQILDFSRRSIIEPSSLDLLPFLKELDKLLGRTLPENILLQFSYQPGSYMIKADPTRLQQVFLNLALNSRDAMPIGGVLKFELSHIEVTAEGHPADPDLTPGPWIQLLVSDTGAGIPQHILPHIFDPFFTTKLAGKGTGLGLAQVYGIVKQHGGNIDVESHLGEGTIFRILLPEYVSDQEPQSETQTEYSALGGGEEILIVEDDPVTREAMQVLLESRNYKVISAKDGFDALNIIDQPQSSIDLIISDIVMPGMGGVTLYYALKQRGQQTKMLFITGHPLDLENQSMLQNEQVEWMQKPFPVQDFLLRIDKLLNHTV